MMFNPVKFLVLFLIKIYQYLLSPILPNRCRFYPSCSAYAVEAFQTFNIFKASYLVCWRIMRCQPFSDGGYDPVIKTKNN